jgi:hypothetical protein
MCFDCNKHVQQVLLSKADGIQLVLFVVWWAKEAENCLQDGKAPSGPFRAGSMLV